jgi:hypothetical protein
MDKVNGSVGSPAENSTSYRLQTGYAGVGRTSIAPRTGYTLLELVVH